MQYTQQDIENASSSTTRAIPEYYLYQDYNNWNLYRLREERLVFCLADQAKILNSVAGSRKRKDYSCMKQILSQKGLSWSEPSFTGQDILEVTIDGHSYFIQFSHGVNVALEYRDQNGSLSWSHCTAREEDIADFLLFMSEVDRRSLELFEQKSLKCHRDQMISDIELPSVELETAHFLEPRGIRYNILHIYGKNRLQVQIVNEIWMEKNVTTDSLEDDLRIIPYLIKRPDCIKRDGRGFSIFHKWGWNRK